MALKIETRGGLQSISLIPNGICWNFSWWLWSYFPAKTQVWRKVKFGTHTQTHPEEMPLARTTCKWLHYYPVKSRPHPWFGLGLSAACKVCEQISLLSKSNSLSSYLKFVEKRVGKSIWNRDQMERVVYCMSHCIVTTTAFAQTFPCLKPPPASWKNPEHPSTPSQCRPKWCHQASNLEGFLLLHVNWNKCSELGKCTLGIESKSQESR